MRRTIALAALALVVGCGAEEGDDSYLTAVIDGRVWSAEALEGQVAYYVEGGSGIWTMASRPVAGGNQLFTLVVPLAPEVGTYPLDQFIARVSYASCPGDHLVDCIWWAAVPDDPGSLTIEKVDLATGLIEGRFSFAGYALGDPEGESKPFTGGQFRLFAPGAIATE